MDVTLRPARAEDAEVCGRICYDAFTTINNEHGFPPDFPNVELSIAVIAMLFQHPQHYSVVAESGGRIIGSNVVDERGPIAGIGPITVDPKVQNSGAGRRMMQHIIDRSLTRGCPSVRLVQAAFHNRSLSLYTKLGFDPREPLSVVSGNPLGLKIPGYDVRPLATADVAVCNDLCMAIHGHNRDGELRDSLTQGSATVVERNGRIVGYATGIAFFSHAVAESITALQALIGATPAFLGPGFLVPTRNAELLRWCLNQGLRVVEPMTLMSIGLYNEPRGAWLPSIAY